MSLIAVFAASTIESRPIRRMIRRRNRRHVSESVIEGPIRSNRVVLVKTGMGMAPANSAAKMLGRMATDAVIVTGFCGSLSSDNQEGQVVLYSDCIAIDGRSSLACSRELVLALASLLDRNGVSSKLVRGLSSNTIAATPPEKRDLSLYGANVVDMESYEIIAAAQAAGIPAIVMRAVSDSVDRTLPDFGRAIGDNGSFATMPLMRACLSNPIRTIQLFNSTRKAIDNLEGALRIVLNSELIGLCTPELEAAALKHGSQWST